VHQILFIPRQPACVAQVSSRLSTVIVRAPNFAFGDLRRKSLEVLATNEPRDFLNLGGRVSVVEIEDNRVGLAAVDTRMSQQVVVCEQLASAPISDASLSSTLRICRSIQPIVFSPVDPTTITAIAPPRSAKPILKRKVFDRFPVIAP